MRQSPALEVAQSIAADHPGPIAVIEPNIESLPESLLRENVSLLKEAHADVSVLLVDHHQFRGMAKPCGRVISARDLWVDDLLA